MANPTTNLEITLPVPGSESSKGTWGTTVNDAFQSLDDVIVPNTGGTFTGVVTMPSPVINTGVSGSAILDSDTMSGVSATTLSSSESIKAYVDSQTHEAGDVTSVVAGSGLTGGGTTGDVTLNIDSTVATLSGSQTLTNKTLTAPLLGTPTSGVMTNVTGTAASLTAGNVTTNANLTGHVTSSGNATTLGSFTVAQLSTALSDASISGNNTGDQTTVTGNAGSATALATARNIGGVSFDGTANIDLPGVNASGTQDTSGTATTATTATNVTVAAESVASSQAVSYQLNVNSTVLFSCANHGLAENQPIIITLGTNPPDGVTSGTIYYVRPGLSGSFSGGLTGVANTFTLGTTPDGDIGNISTIGWNGSVSHTFEKVRYPLFALSPTGDLPAKSGGGVTLTASGKLTSTTFAGDLTGDVTGDLTGNVTGNADTVTTNANLTGHVTSSGNAATLGSFTVAQLSSALSDASISGNNTGDLTNGIANTNNVVIDSASVADDEYARFTASGLESRSTSEVLSDIGAQASLTNGIANTNNVIIDHASVADDDYAKFTASGLEGRSATEVKTDLSLNNVENSALSTWTGSSNIATVGTIGTGTWNGIAVAQTYIADQAINEAKLQISNAPTNGHILTARSGNTGGMTWEAAGTGFEPLGTGVAMAIALG